jgi:hypothetical protein
VGQIKLPK